MVPIPQTDPHANYRAHRVEIDAAMQRVLDSGRYILGEEVVAFEREFADFVGAAHAVGVASGTDALELALRACGVGAADLVFTVAHSDAAAGEILSLPMHPELTPAAVDTVAQRISEWTRLNQ
jgi:dTDP-4-amino-4,6-dideoxygalactose transaminase